MIISKTINAAHAANFSKNLMIENYRDTVDSLLRQLQEKNIAFVIVGGIALLQYVQGRNTEDIDLILAAKSLSTIDNLVVEDRNEMFVRATYDGLQVDILLAEHPLFGRILDHFVTDLSYESASYPTVNIEGLMLLKLFALPSLYRQMNWDKVTIYESDLLQLLRSSDSNDENLICQLGAHLSASDLKELKRLLIELRDRIANHNRFG